MNFNISNISIIGLYKIYNYNIPIAGDKLILVGENGSMKTTIISMIYYLLSCQWSKLYEYNFKAIELTANDEKLIVAHDDIDKFYKLAEINAKYERFMPKSLVKKITSAVIDMGFVNKIDKFEFFRTIERDYKIPKHFIADYSEEISKYINKTNLRLPAVAEKIKKELKAQVIYLPTYRRIEQELRAILPHLMPVDEANDRRMLGVKIEQDIDVRSNDYIELVKFGMEDVVGLINKTMDNMKEFIRNELSTLTGTYLQDVISGKYKNVKPEALHNINVEALESILDRIDERILPTEEKERLKHRIIEISKLTKLSAEKKISAHFILKLYELLKQQHKREKNIYEFVSICNKYISDKKLKYNNNNFTIKIFLSTLSSGEIEFKSLSSGEKQIVSLFCHILLSENKKFFILIDEPELSLSVKWQSMLLPDIMNTNKCSGIIAVTHSPFMFDNDFRNNVASLDLLMEQHG